MSSGRPVTAANAAGGMARPMSSRLAAPGTARPGTGLRGVIGAAAAVQRMPAVTSHGVPATSHGQAGGGAGRAVQDRNFYLGQVRAKMAELGTEVEAMRREIQQIEQDQRETAALQRRQTELQEEVARLQGQLADHNVLLDKIRATPDLAAADLRAESSRLAGVNEVDRGRCDEVFGERSERERECAEAEKETAELRERFQAEIGKMSEERRKAYFELKQQNEEAIGKVRASRAELDALRGETGRLEARMKGDANRQKALGLYEEIHKLRKKKDQLAADLAAPQLSIPEERERLMQHIKLVNQAIAQTTRQIAETEQEKEQLRAQMAQMDAEMRETPENRERRKKLGEARQKDREMTEFLDRAPAARQELAQQKARLEWTILELLQHLSKRALQASAAPEAEKQREIHESLEAKTGQVAQGEQTYEKLQQVLEQRKDELKKMETMDEKLSAEIKATREHTEKMQSELEEFAGAGALREDMERRRERLAKDKQWMVHQREVIGQEANVAESRADEANKRCTEDETHAQLDVLEKQLRHQEQNLFQLRTFVESKSAECDYKPVAADATQLATEINEALCRSATAF